MRQRLLENYFSEASGTHFDVLASAIKAGYSPQKASQKQPKFKAWIAEEFRKRPPVENPATTHSPVSGRLLPRWLVEWNQPAPAKVEQPTPENPVVLLEQREQEGYVRTANGTRLPTWAIGDLSAQELASQRQRQFRADSYRVVRRDLSGNLVVEG
jgi:hypothetical protein